MHYSRATRIIEAITFDFWDTIAIDDSDEQKRTVMGLPNKAEARVQLFVRKITQHHPQISASQAAEAYQHANQRFNRDWHDGQRTPGVATRIYYAYEHLGLRTRPGQYSTLMREVDELIREIENMEVRIPPDFAPGIREILHTLAQEYKLGIISDTIHTNGRGLRKLLERGGILPYFSYFIFSDEIGAAKPSPHVFRQAAVGLRVAPSQIVHIGDRESNDVTGPRAAGMHAILYTGIKDRGSQRTQADAVCTHHAELPWLIKRLR